MELTRILSIAATILGIYILFAFFFQGGPILANKQSYHVGCYISDSLIQHDLIVSKISQIKEGSWAKYNQQQRLVPTDVIEKKGVEVARSFEIFINEYKVYKSQSKIGHEIFRAVSEAKKQFSRCVDEAGDHEKFEERECNKDWEDYENCSKKLDDLKNRVKNKLKQKNQLMNKIKNMLSPDSDSQKTNKDSREDLLAEFRRKDKQLQEKQKQLELKLKRFIEKITSTEYNLKQKQNQRNNARNLYIQCSQHRTEYRQCEELTRQTLSLGSSNSIEKLGEKVQRKREQLQKVQSLFNQRKSLQLKQVSQKYFEEYKTLFKLFIETKVKVKKHCGCTQDEEVKLKNNYNKLQNQYLLKREELENYKRQIYDSNSTYLDVKQKRKQLLTQLNDILEVNPTPDPKVDDSLTEQLQELKKKIKFLSVEIEVAQEQFGKLKIFCNDLKDKLIRKLAPISKITDCLSKYKYYSELKRSLQKQGQRQIKMNEAVKRKLVNSVEDFKV